MWPFSTTTPVPSSPMSSTLPTMPTARMARSNLHGPGVELRRRAAHGRGQHPATCGRSRPFDTVAPVCMLHALGFEGLDGPRLGDLLVLDRQHAGQHLDHGDLGATEVVRRSSRTPCRWRRSRSPAATGRHAYRAPWPPCRSRLRLAVGLQARQHPRPGARSPDTMCGAVSSATGSPSFLVTSQPARLPPDRAAAVEDRDLPFFFNRLGLTPPWSDACRDLARALDHLLQIEARHSRHAEARTRPTRASML